MVFFEVASSKVNCLMQTKAFIHQKDNWIIYSAKAHWIFILTFYKLPYSRKDLSQNHLYLILLCFAESIGSLCPFKL